MKFEMDKNELDFLLNKMNIRNIERTEMSLLRQRDKQSNRENDIKMKLSKEHADYLDWLNVSNVWRCKDCKYYHKEEELCKVMENGFFAINPRCERDACKKWEQRD